MKAHPEGPEASEPGRPGDVRSLTEDPPRSATALQDALSTPRAPTAALHRGTIMRLQGGAGNAAVSRLLARSPARSSGPTTGTRAAPGPAPVGAGVTANAGTLLATPGGSDGATGTRTTPPPPRAPDSPSSPAPSPALSDGATAPPGPAQASGDLGPLSALGGLRDVRPSAFTQHLAGAAGLVPTALAGEQSASALPALPAPTGLAPGAPAAGPAAPTIGDQAPPTVSAPSQGGDRPDPGVADQWASGGTAAVHRAAAEGDAPAPKLGGSLSPTVSPVALPEVTLPAGGPVGTAPAGPTPADPREAAALDAAAGTPVHQLVGRLLAPAGAAGAAHRAEATQARTAAQTQIANLGTDATARQHAVRASADQEVLHEHAQWTTSRETIVQAHAADISSVAGGTKTEISQTVRAGRRAGGRPAHRGGRQRRRLEWRPLGPRQARRLRRGRRRQGCRHGGRRGHRRHHRRRPQPRHRPAHPARERRPPARVRRGHRPARRRRPRLGRDARRRGPRATGDHPARPRRDRRRTAPVGRGRGTAEAELGPARRRRQIGVRRRSRRRPQDRRRPGEGQGDPQAPRQPAAQVHHRRLRGRPEEDRGPAGGQGRAARREGPRHGSGPRAPAGRRARSPADHPAAARAVDHGDGGGRLLRDGRQPGEGRRRLLRGPLAADPRQRHLAAHLADGDLHRGVPRAVGGAQRRLGTGTGAGPARPLSRDRASAHQHRQRRPRLHRDLGGPDRARGWSRRRVRHGGHLLRGQHGDDPGRSRPRPGPAAEVLAQRHPRRRQAGTRCRSTRGCTRRPASARS